MKKQLVAVWTLVCAAAAMPSCASDPNLELLEAEDEDEWESRRRLMDVTFQRRNANGEWDPPVSMLQDSFRTEIADHCARVLNDTSTTFSGCVKTQAQTTGAMASCTEELCRAELNLCMAHTYMELADAPGDTVLIQVGATASILVSPQSTATIAGFGEEALRAARQAITSSGESLRRASGDTVSSSACTTTGSMTTTVVGVNQTFGRALASTMVEASHITEEAMDVTVRTNVAVADTDLAQIPNSGQASRTAWTAPVLSHLHAVQVMTGGTGYAAMARAPAEYAAITDVGVCPQNCDEACRLGVSLIRDSGLRLPNVISTTTSTADLVEGNGVFAAEGGMRQRLADRYDLTSVSSLNRDQFLDRFSLPLTSLEQARSYLRHEATIFNRDTTLPGVRLQLPNASETAAVRQSVHTYYAETTHPPSRIDPIHFTALARGSQDTGEDRHWANPTTDTNLTANSSSPRPVYADRGAAFTLDYAGSVARQVIGTAVLSESDVLEPLAIINAQQIASRAARVEHCYRYSGAQDIVRVRVFGRSVAGDIRLVRGTTGLSCATTGFVEGERCSMDRYRVLPGTDGQFVSATSTNAWADDVDPTGSVTTLADTRVGFRTAVGFEFQIPASLVPFRWYVVERRPGSTTSAAGNWEAIGSVAIATLAGNTASWSYCHSNPYDTETARRTAAAFDPAPDSCSAPARDCYGAYTGDLPLEDELIDDGNDFESSWRHHLAIARQAAEEADRLGEEVITAGLDMDRRAEDALEELERLCGFTGNVEHLFPATVTTSTGARVPSLGNVVSGNCSDASPSCAAGYQCVPSSATTGRCVLDIAATASSAMYDSRVLAECLGQSPDGGSNIVPVVGLGSQRLCVPYDPTSPNILCPAGSTTPCPRPVDAGVACNANEYAVDGDDLLRIFRSTDHGSTLLGSSSAEPLNCSVLRRMRRASTPLAADVRTVVTSNFFSPESVRHWAQRIGWRGYPNDYSQFMLDGSPWYGTGQPFRQWSADGSTGAGPQSGLWPCAAVWHAGSGLALTPTGDCAMSGDPNLFCATTTCTDRTIGRTPFNDRMARAAITLSVLGGNSLAGIWHPVRYEESDYLYSSRRGSALVQDEFGATWRIANYGEFGDDQRSGIFAWPLTNPTAPVWHAWNATGPIYGTQDDPVAFLNFGNTANGSPTAVSHMPPAVWNGMCEGSVDGGPLEVTVLDALRHTAPSTSEMWAGRDRYEWWHEQGGRDVDGHITELFNEPVYDWSANGYDFHDNQARIFIGGFTQANVLDALELMCTAATESERIQNCDPSRPPGVSTVDDIPALRAYLSCLANRLERIGETVVIQNVPRRVVQIIRGDLTTIQPDEGEYGRTANRLRQALRSMGSLPRSIAAQIRYFRDDLELFELQLRSMGAREELADLRFASGTIEQVAACASSASGSNPGAVATCSAAAAQIAIQFRISEIEHSSISDERRAALIEFNQTYQDRQETLVSLSEQIMNAADEANDALSALRTNQRSASRQLAYALFASSDAGGTQYQVNTVMRRRYNTALVRYQRAFRSAVQLSELARRALEQRLGVELEHMHGAMSFVDPPDSWAGSICESTGIDYGRIRDETALALGDEYSDAYVGDYVDNLENFFESYRVDFPYTSGADVAVVSLRDDVFNVREPCDWPTYNLLALSNQPTGVLPAEEGAVAVVPWAASGCGTVGGSVEDSCVSVTRREGAGPGAAGAPEAYRVTFASGVTAGTPTSNYSNSAEWQQSVSVAHGTYRLSWYGRSVTGIGITSRDPQLAVELRSTSAGTLTNSAVFQAVETLASGWQRYYRFYEVPSAGVVRVAVTPQTMNPANQQMVDIAGVSLESVDSLTAMAASAIMTSHVSADRPTYDPRAFVSTTDFGTRMVQACEDTDGSWFRPLWEYYCDAELCDGGIGHCAEGEEPRRLCYWQVRVNLSRDLIDAGERLSRAGFALGNFNYRLDTVAVNFVGTGSRACDDPSRVSSCYSSGYIPYSIIHEEPYNVVGYDGREVHAPLFVGTIEHARGLAAERYLSNPLSSADRALIDDYLRRELRGRPMSGHFAIRIWDVPGVNFDGIEDVQLLVNYRYFTRTPTAE